MKFSIDQIQKLIEYHYAKNEEKFKTTTLSLAASIAKDGDEKLAKKLLNLTQPKGYIKIKHPLPDLSNNKDISILKNLLKDGLNYIAFIKDTSPNRDKTEKFITIYAPSFEQLICKEGSGVKLVEKQYKGKSICIEYIDIRDFCKFLALEPKSECNVFGMLKILFSDNYVINPRFATCFQSLLNQKENIAVIDQETFFYNFLEQFEEGCEEVIKYSDNNSDFIPFIFDGLLMKYFIKEYKSFSDSYDFALKEIDLINLKERSEFVRTLEGLISDLRLAKECENDYIKRSYVKDDIDKALKDIMRKAMIMEIYREDYR